MNALETAAMLDKITDDGGSVKLIDGKPVARNVPAHFLAKLAANRDSVIRILEGQQNLPKPIARKRDVLRLADKFEIAWHDRGDIGCAAFDD